MPRAVAYIAVVNKSEKVRAKLAAKHDGIQDYEINEAVILTEVQDSWWDDDEDRGWRLMVIGTTAARRTLFVVLYPVDEDDGIWNLGTAIRQEG